MSKNSARKSQATETYRITFHGAVAAEQGFIQAWDAQPHGRRLAWARNVLNMGMLVHAHGEMRTLNTEPSTSATAVRTIDLSLSRYAPDELAIIQHFERLPMRRRTEKLRDLLIAGRGLIKNLPLILSTLRAPSSAGKSGVEEVPETVPVTEIVETQLELIPLNRGKPPKPQKQIEHNTPASPGLEPELGENPAQAPAAEVESVSVVHVLPDTPVHSGIQAHELDIDLSLLDGPVHQDGQVAEQNTETQPVKRPELLQLFS